jgi:RsmE family RNA methyltransferase
MGVGDTFDVGVVNGPAGKALIESLGEKELEIAVEWGDRPPLPPPVHLLVGMCRPATARKVLTTAPTLGVRSLSFAETGRSDPAYARASLWSGDEWRARLIEGVEQAFDTYVPPVETGAALVDAVAKLPRDGARLALDVYEGTRPLTSVQLGEDSPVCLAIGPERGWNKNDRQLLLKAGFELVSLNERVLRVETAVTVGLTLVLSAMGAY